MSESASFQSVAGMLGDYRQGVLSGVAPTFYSIGATFSHIEVGPGLVTLVGGAPGSGKTALVMQWVVDALILSPNVRAIVANVEMPVVALVDRQVARLADVDLSSIRHRDLSEEERAKVERGLATLASIGDRLGFVRSPFTTANIASAADAFAADVIVLDYLQRIEPSGKHSDRRSAVGAIMAEARVFADAGTAVVCVAAVGRQKGDRGQSSYEGLNLASYRESSELEFGCDDAFILAKSKDGLCLHHLKCRHGEPRDVALQFDGARQRFEAIRPTPTHESLHKLWGKTP